MESQRAEHDWVTFTFTWSVWDLCSPVKNLRTPIWVAALEGGVFTTGPWGKSLICQLLMWMDIISFPIMNLEEVPWVKPLHCPTPSITSPTRAQGRASVLKAEWYVFIKQQIYICFFGNHPKPHFNLCKPQNNLTWTTNSTHCFGWRTFGTTGLLWSGSLFLISREDRVWLFYQESFPSDVSLTDIQALESKHNAPVLSLLG